MSIVTTTEIIQGWCRDHICSEIMLKKPDGKRDDKGYQYELVHPAAFAWYIPTKDKLPPETVAPSPSLCVLTKGGTDDLINRQREIKVHLWFSTWDPGEHGKDIYKEVGENLFRQMGEEEAKEYYEKSGEGWRDAWNFVDLALRKLENAEYIEGHRIKKEAGITFGPYTDHENIILFYPHWYAWVEFTILEPLIRTPVYKELL